MANLKPIAALAGLAFALPAVGLSEGAMPVSECNYMQSYGADKYYEDHADIGAGFIMYAQRSQYGIEVKAADCFSGLTLTISTDDDDPSTFKGFQKSVERSVLASAKSSKKVTLSTLEEQFSSQGIWTRLAGSKVEHCACAAFYPEAKGKKEDWEVRKAHP